MNHINWNKISDQLPPFNKNIVLVWNCPEDQCAGQVICELQESGKYWIKPGKYLQKNEIPTHWLLLPEFPHNNEEDITYEDLCLVDH